jgi:hypothetical protein
MSKCSRCSALALQEPTSHDDPTIYVIAEVQANRRRTLR